MKIEIHRNKGIKFAEIHSDRIEMANLQNALGLMANCNILRARNNLLKHS